MSGLYRRSDFNRALNLPVERAVKGGWRSAFRRDFARLVHSPAFRRLQGKTQLFAGLDSDYFRNRLTHSLEVAQIAKSMALRFNSSLPDSYQLDLDLVEFAGLAHDLGHPPFGHTGEKALNELMASAGGFEGNAQTLRILARLEKKLVEYDLQFGPDGEPRFFGGPEEEIAVGLNLCSRTLASVLKYDDVISQEDGSSQPGIKKGYYKSEEKLVGQIKCDVAGANFRGTFKTIECQIMDFADDIAYSTYDIEDAFKGGLMSPLDLFITSTEIKVEVCRRIKNEIGEAITVTGLEAVLREMFPILIRDREDAGDEDRYEVWPFVASRDLSGSNFFRTAMTGHLVNQFVEATSIKVNKSRPALSAVTMEPGARIQMSVMKQMVYESLIQSHRLKTASHRGERIVKKIFGAIEDSGGLLLPRDYKTRFDCAGTRQKKRVICDFIAGMTDRYAVEFYARLGSSNHQTMFKPD